jgi:hypothetical protein
VVVAVDVGRQEMEKSEALMTTFRSTNLRFPASRLAWLLATAALAGTAWLQAAPKELQTTFSTPQEAVEATIDAAEHNDTGALLRIFGPEGKDIVESGDAAEDKDLRSEFARAAHEKLQVLQDPLRPDMVEFTVGTQEWPFPVPVIRKDGKWQLDSVGGRLEILARRIGANELNVMDICRGYAEAQLEYASAPHDGDRALRYAQKVISTPGTQDGLYTEGAKDSLVSQAFADANVTASNATTAGKKPAPYHGYYFRVLKSQGPDAALGVLDYVVNGKMIGGFALVAWPAEYGVSGVRTLIINNDGVVYEKDLGAATGMLARQTTRFNPDKSWHAVELE